MTLEDLALAVDQLNLRIDALTMRIEQLEIVPTGEPASPPPRTLVAGPEPLPHRLRGYGRSAAQTHRVTS